MSSTSPWRASSVRSKCGANCKPPRGKPNTGGCPGPLQPIVETLARIECLLEDQNREKPEDRQPGVGEKQPQPGLC